MSDMITVPVCDDGDPALRTVARYADGQDRTYVPDGHLVAMPRRIPFPLDDARQHPLHVIGLVENCAGWCITVGRSADGAVKRTKGGGWWTVTDVAITDPHGHTEHLISGHRSGHGNSEAVTIASSDPLNLGALFLARPALSTVEYRHYAALAWARAMKIHHWSRDIVGPGTRGPNEHVPWVRRADILHWLAWPTKADAARWAIAVGNQSHLAQPFFDAGWSIEDSKPWIMADIEHSAASILAVLGWTADQSARLRHALLPHHTGPWDRLGPLEPWVAFDAEPDHVILAVQAGLSPAEAAALDPVDPDALAVLAALRQ
jgi:hypothetical protein